MLILNGILLTIIGVSDFTIFRKCGVEIGHQRGDVLSGRKPTVDVFTGVQKSSSSYGYVPHFMTVERKVELELYRLKIQIQVYSLYFIF